MNSGCFPWFIPFHKRFRNRQQSLRCDLTVQTLVSQRSSASQQVIRMMVLEYQLNAVLQTAFRVTCHSFLNLGLSFSGLYRAGKFILRSQSVILTVDGLIAETI
jgi:hypothetical protein